MENYWEYIHVNYEDIKRVAKQTRLPVVIARILVNRGYNTPEVADRFINPSMANLYDPFLMKGMNEAVSRILQAIEEKEKICIYGDYDVDGVTSIIILKDIIQRLGGCAIFTIPNRLEEGYGLNIQRLKEVVSDKDIRLIVTVDTGTTSVEESKFIIDSGIDLIITDHHEEGNEIPTALSILNPKLSDNSYPFKELAGVGVIFKLAQALSQRSENRLPLESYLKIAAIGTIADIVPLIDENRIIARLGLDSLPNSNNLGLKTLLAELRLDGQELEATDISFRLGPRINALGRLGDVGQAVDLLFTSNRAYAMEIVQEMNRLNHKRQKLENDIYCQAIDIIENDPEFEISPVIIVTGNKWHLGVIGIVASRLANKYYKPAIVISIDGDFGKASGRSVPEFDLKSTIDKTSDLLESYGGHKMAVGFQIKRENINTFKRSINKKVKKILDGHLFIREDKIDADISFLMIDQCFLKHISLLKPFGHSNPKPVFRSKGVTIEGKPFLIKDKHIKMKLTQNNRVLDAICWKHPEWFEKLDPSGRLDVIFHITRNFWRGEEKIRLDILDFNIVKD